ADRPGQCGVLALRRYHRGSAGDPRRLRTAGERGQRRDLAGGKDGRAAASRPGRAAAGESGFGKGTDAMKLYRFLTGPDDSSFCHKVTAALNKGWHIYGSPTYAFDAET